MKALLFTFFLCCPCDCEQPKRPEFSNVVANALQSTVEIHDERGLNGAGVFVSDRKMITCFHVIRRAQKLYAKCHGDQTLYRLKLWKLDRANDLAYLELLDYPPACECADCQCPNCPDSCDCKCAKTHAKVRIRDDLPPVGTSCFVVGHPRKLTYSVTRGVVSAHGRDVPFPDLTQKNLMQVDAPVHGGNSGGPVLDLQGRLIGLVIGGSGVQGGGIGWVIPCTTVQKFLD